MTGAGGTPETSSRHGKGTSDRDVDPKSDSVGLGSVASGSTRTSPRFSSGLSHTEHPWCPEHPCVLSSCDTSRFNETELDAQLTESSQNGARCAERGSPRHEESKRESMLGTVPKSNPTDNPGDQVLFFLKHFKRKTLKGENHVRPSEEQLQLVSAGDPNNSHSRFYRPSGSFLA